VTGQPHGSHPLAPPPTPPVIAPSWVVAADNDVGVVVEFIAALLVVVEVLVLLAAVASRYLFHNPLVWTDELALLLFIWLAMLGAGVAFRRGAATGMAWSLTQSGFSAQLAAPTGSLPGGR